MSELIIKNKTIRILVHYPVREAATSTVQIAECIRNTLNATIRIVIEAIYRPTTCTGRGNLTYWVTFSYKIAAIGTCPELRDTLAATICPYVGVFYASLALVWSRTITVSVAYRVTMSDINCARVPGEILVTNAMVVSVCLCMSNAL